MARSVWSGSLSFGLVNVPVKLVPATRDQDVRFRQLDPEGNRIRYKRVSEKTGEEVPFEEIVKGYEISKGRYVLMERDELEKLAPRASHTIDVEDFVDLQAIDPLFFERTYYVVPEERAGASKAYALLLRAMEEAGKVAVARIVMRDKQHLAAVRPHDGLLALSTMRFSEEVVAPGGDVRVGVDPAAVSERELELARQIIDSLAAEWDPARYNDTYRQQVEELVEAKARGDQIVEPAPVSDLAPVGDLMAALRASLEQAERGERRGSGDGRSRTARKSAARAPSGSRASKAEGPARPAPKHARRPKSA